MSAVPDQTYTGSEIKPSLTVKVGSKNLKKGTDYTLAYANNVNVGTATITIKAAKTAKYQSATAKVTIQVK